MQRLIALMCQYEDMGAAVLDDEDEAESIHYRRLTMRWRELLGREPGRGVLLRLGGLPQCA